MLLSGIVRLFDEREGDFTTEHHGQVCEFSGRRSRDATHRSAPRGILARLERHLEKIEKKIEV
jgi:hypothetical protein